MGRLKTGAAIVFSLLMAAAESYCMTFFLARQFYSPEIGPYVFYVASVAKINLITLVQFLPCGVASVLLSILALTLLSRLWEKKPALPSTVLRASASLLPVLLLPLTLFYRVPEGRMVLAAAIVGLAAWLAWPLYADSLRALRGSVLGGRLAAPAEKYAAPALAAASGVFMLAVGLIRHRAHWSSLIDLGLFFEIYHNARGELLYAPSIGQNFFGEHFSPILVLLWPFLKLFPWPATLLVIQAVTISTGGYLLFLWARARLASTSLALALTAAYLLGPYMQQSAFFDFHIDMLEPPMLFGAMLALERRKSLLVWLCVLLLWCTKEDTFIYTSVIAIYAMISQRRWLLGAGILVAGLAQAGFILGWLLPHLRHPYTRDFFSTTGPVTGYAFIQRYSHMGYSSCAILRTIFLNPLYLLGYLTTQRTLSSILALLLPFGALAFAGRWRIIFLIPTFEILVGHPSMSAFEYYYGAIVMPFAVMAAVEGGYVLRSRAGSGRPRRLPLPAWDAGRMAAALAVVALALMLWHPSSYASSHRCYQSYLRTPHQEKAEELMAMIPAGARVSATGYLAVHLQRGRDVMMFPYGLKNADYVLVDLQRPSWPDDFYEVQDKLCELVSRKGFEIVKLSDEWLVLLHRPSIPPADGAAQAARLRKWLDEPVMETELNELTRFRGSEKRGSDASNGAYLSVTSCDSRGEGHVVYGPFSRLLPGKYTALVRLRWRPDTIIPWFDGARVASIDVTAQRGGIKALRELTVEKLKAVEGQWFDEELHFTVAPGDLGFEFRVYYHDVGALDVDVIRVKKL